jgi:hypothetical protein
MDEHLAISQAEYDSLLLHTEKLSDFEHAVMWAAVAMSPAPQDDEVRDYASLQFWQCATPFLAELQQFVYGLQDPS